MKLVKAQSYSIKRRQSCLPVVIISTESCTQIGTLVEQAEARSHIRKKTCGRASHVKKKSCDRASVLSMFVVPLSDVTVLAMTSLKKYYFF